MAAGILLPSPPSTPGTSRHPFPAKLDASRLHFTKTDHPSQVPQTRDLGFGKYVTGKLNAIFRRPTTFCSAPTASSDTIADHILQIEWDETCGWHQPKILPYQEIRLDPTAGVFHYGFECFEGMKVYRDPSGQLRFFRPDMNLDRFNKSAIRIGLPSLDGVELLKLIAEFVKVDERFVFAHPGYSLYLRPVFIGTSPGFGVTAPTSALLYVIASPVGAYYSTGFEPILLEATSSRHATRAWPGGTGNQKIGGNYAPSIAPEKAAKSRGFHQCLWLFGDDDAITEAGTMNLFIAFKNQDQGRQELVTPPLDGTILPGVTRDCVLSLARERLVPRGWQVNERKVCMKELSEASKAESLVDVFGTGTAAVVTPIRAIKWQDQLVDCGLSPQQNAGEITVCMKKWIESRQYGNEEHDWSVPVGHVSK
ncbi:MAG: hypothetical protein LQ352_003049 [Teloschistes flavicans]|nr:MAG: hypothetical protein LQ352_003049 [Teloschistes flavicans]